jgi:hypothetical protein
VCYEFANYIITILVAFLSINNQFQQKEEQLFVQLFSINEEYGDENSNEKFSSSKQENLMNDEAIRCVSFLILKFV